MNHRKETKCVNSQWPARKKKCLVWCVLLLLCSVWPVYCQQKLSTAMLSCWGKGPGWAPGQGDGLLVLNPRREIEPPRAALVHSVVSVVPLCWEPCQSPGTRVKAEAWMLWRQRKVKLCGHKCTGEVSGKASNTVHVLVTSVRVSGATWDPLEIISLTNQCGQVGFPEASQEAPVALKGG